MRRITAIIFVALAFIWFGACRKCSAQQIIGRPMLPISSVDPAAVSLTNSLKTYWRMDETSGTRVDVFGLRDLTDNNTVTATTGIATNAAQFTAANTEYLSQTQNPPTGQTFSFAFWMKLTSFAASERYLINSFGPPEGDCLGFTVHTADSKARWWIHTAGGGYKFVTNSTVLATNTWYFAYVARDQAGGTIKISINNGTQDISTDGALSLGTPNNFRIGNYVASNLPWDGLIDEVGCWDRTLTSGELTYLYNGGAGRAYTPGAASPFH